MTNEVIDEACQENKDIDSISFTSNALNNEHGFSLDKYDLVQTTNVNPISIKVIDNDDEESNNISID